MSGAGSTAVLVHGGTLTSTMWDDVRAFLTTPSLAVDLPGRRYKPADLSLVTREDWVRSVCDDVADAGLGDVVLVGHSSGGYVIPGVAASLSARADVTVRSLVFVSATVPAEGKRPVDYLREDLHDLAVKTRDVVVENARHRTLGGLRPGEEAISTSLEIVENGPRMGLEAPWPLFEAFTWVGVPTTCPVSSSAAFGTPSSPRIWPTSWSRTWAGPLSSTSMPATGPSPRIPPSSLP